MNVYYNYFVWLPTDDDDLRSGDDVSGDDDKETNDLKEKHRKSKRSALTLQHRTDVIPISVPMSMMSAMTATPSSSSSSRRNKRKNFQPRNIRPNDSADSDEDNEKNRHDEPETASEFNAVVNESSACCSISESKILMISSGHSDSDGQDNGHHHHSGGVVDPKMSPSTVTPLANRRKDEMANDLSGRRLPRNDSRVSDEGDLSGSSNNSSRSGSRSSSRNGSTASRSGAAVDLRLRPSPFKAEGDDDDGGGGDHLARVSGLEMKTWMLFWQQQQSCNDNNSFKSAGKLPFAPQLPDFAGRQKFSEQSSSSQKTSTVAESDHPASLKQADVSTIDRKSVV